MSAQGGGGGGGGGTGGAAGDQKDRKRKESILDLSKYLDKPIRVKFSGGREAAGTLKGYDPLVNLVLDDTTEYMRESSSEISAIGSLHQANCEKSSDETRLFAGNIWSTSCDMFVGSAS
ncbi:unnamed protein product [Nesidiocoris tenuis]|uniref:Sm domain-containing protein n=1 Tax=Nesidiocoris tenuis TaxID=355587 RepID=A0A6H5GE02_9HEMI|nr:unnamed protein product [Nesidiocoris tenuis]